MAPPLPPISPELAGRVAAVLDDESVNDLALLAAATIYTMSGRHDVAYAIEKGVGKPW